MAKNSFVSNGSHIPLGFTNEEYARYGRNLLMSKCYYIIKNINKILKGNKNEDFKVYFFGCDNVSI